LFQQAVSFSETGKSLECYLAFMVVADRFPEYSEVSAAHISMVLLVYCDNESMLFRV
jgi:hypothetical protein